MSRYFLQKDEGTFAEVGSAISFGVIERERPVEDGGRNTGEKEYYYISEANYGSSNIISLSRFETREEANTFNCNLIEWMCMTNDSKDRCIHIEHIVSGKVYKSYSPASKEEAQDNDDDA